MFIRSNYTIALIDVIFDNLLKEYESLEKIVFVAYEFYEQSNDDKIKHILEQNISIAKNHIDIMLEIILNNADVKLRDNYKEKLNAKLDELNEIERNINGIKK